MSVSPPRLVSVRRKSLALLIKIERDLGRARDFHYDIAAQKVLRLFEEVAAEVRRR